MGWTQTDVDVQFQESVDGQPLALSLFRAHVFLLHSSKNLQISLPFRPFSHHRHHLFPTPTPNASQVCICLSKFGLGQSSIPFHCRYHCHHSPGVFTTKVFSSTVLGLWGLPHEKVGQLDRLLSRTTTYLHPWENRVRCDLKDLPFSSTGTQPQCSNCKERGLKCVSVCFLISNPSSHHSPTPRLQ